MKTRALMLATALALLPTMGWAQTPDERIGAALSQAQESGIPIYLLEDRIAEGQVKGVPMDRIATAVEQRLHGLNQARAVIGSGPDGADPAHLSLGADALGSGVSQAVLDELLADTPPEQRTVALAALGYLAEQGIVPEEALAAVKGAVARGDRGFESIPGFAGPPAGLPISDELGVPGMGPGGVNVGPPSSVPAPGQVDPPSPPRRGPPVGGGA